MDIRLERLARLLVSYSNNVRRGDVVEIQGDAVGAPLIEAIYLAALARGALVRVSVSLSGISELLLRHGNDHQIQYYRPTLVQDIKDVNCLFQVWGEPNTRALTSVDPARQQLRSRAMRPLRDLFLERVGKKQLRWVGTIFPTHGMAQDADMSLGEFTDFFLRACKCDQRDPIEAWKEVQRRQQGIVRFLSGKKTIRILGRETDLTLSVEGRKWINCCGMENMPDGEVFTSPIENSANGKILYSFPACHGGREVEGIRLVFKKGRVIEASAEKNQEYLHKMLDTDEGSRRLGELAFGLNEDIQRFTKDILFDEKIGGTTHLAVGSSYPETGGKNKSSLHWDMICDLRKGGEVLVDDRLVYMDGKWMI